jgi:AbrB family looped-hinge helix DNA binding protein
LAGNRRWRRPLSFTHMSLPCDHCPVVSLPVPAPYFWVRDKRDYHVQDRMSRSTVWVAKMAFDRWVSPLYGSRMNTTVTLDKAGRVVIPKSLRDELHLEPGDTLELESEGERVTLRPVRSQSPLRKEQGVWVFRGSKKLAAASTDSVLQQLRQERDRDNGGSRP